MADNAAEAAAPAAEVERYINITDVIKRANIEIEQCTRIATTSDPKLQKIYATAAVFNIMLILKDLSDGRDALSAAAEAENTALLRTKDTNSVFAGISNKVRMMHIMIKNMVRIYNIDYNNYKSIDTENVFEDSLYTAPSAEDKLDDNYDLGKWRVGRGKVGSKDNDGETLYGFGLPEAVPENKGTAGGFRKSRRNIRKRIKRISTRRN